MDARIGRRRSAGIAVAAALFGSGLATLPAVAQDADGASTTATVVAPNFLHFVVSATRGTSELLDADQGLFHVLFEGVSPDVAYFGNRGRDIAETMETRVFFKRWIKPQPNSYIIGPPNAAIVFADTDGTVRTALGKINAPYYDGETGILSFTVTPIGGADLDIPAALSNPTLLFADTTVCGTFGSWGDLPGETQLDPECHATHGGSLAADEPE